MRRKQCLIGLLCLLLLFCSACGQSGKSNENADAEDPSSEVYVNRIPDGEKPDSMTIMVYMVGSDLEAATAAATNDMKEMEESGVNLSKVKLLVYTGGSPKWHNETLEIPTDSNAVFELTKDGFVQVTDFEAQSMGEPSSLTRFLEYGYENYKSDSYSLILWDHGNGPVMGYGSDIQYGKDALTLPEMEEALSASPFGKDEKFTFMGFDACLMSSVELACMADDYAEYLIASQEVEPGFGWNYAFLKKCCKVGNGELIREIVDQYISYSEGYFEQNEFFKSEVTLSVMDLSHAKDLEQAVDSLFGEAAEDVSGSFSQLAVDRVETRAFGRATTGSEYDLVDLQALMNSMNSSYEEETKAVQDILQKLIVYNDANTVESCGVSLYYPYYNKKYYEDSWKESYEDLGLLPNYIQYLERYGQIWLGTDMKEYFNDKLVAEEGESSGTYTLQLTEEQAEHYADGGYYILKRMGEDAYSPVYYSQNVTNEEGLLTAEFDGKVIYFGDDLGTKSIPVTRVLDEVDGKTRYAVFPNLKGSVASGLEAGSLAARIVLSVDPETDNVEVLEFTEETGEEIKTGKAPQVDLSEWVRVQFYEIRGRYLTRDDDGRILPFWDWPENDWIIGQELSLADGLHFTYEPIYDDGSEYFLMFDVMDVQGNQYSSELYPITLEEAPEQEETAPTEAGTIEESSLTVFEREGVKCSLNLVKDSITGQTIHCFSVENSNDFSVRLNIDEFCLNDRVNCSEMTGYMTVAPGTVEYEVLSDLETNRRIAGIEIPEQLNFTVSMVNEVNDKTLIHDEKFVVRFGENAKAKATFVPYKGAYAEEQVLLDEEQGLKITLLGAGYQLNLSQYFPDENYGNLQVLCKIENVSDELQHITIKGMEVNGLFQEADEFILDDVSVELQAGQIHYKTWEMSGNALEEQGITDVTSLVYCLTTESGNKAKEEKLAITFAEE